MFNSSEQIPTNIAEIGSYSNLFECRANVRERFKNCCKQFLMMDSSNNTELNFQYFTLQEMFNNLSKKDNTILNTLRVTRNQERIEQEADERKEFRNLMEEVSIHKNNICSIRDQGKRELKFSGKSGDWDTFIGEFESCCNNRNTTEKMEYFQKCLPWSVKKMVKNLNFEEAKTQLNDHFTHNDTCIGEFVREVLLAESLGMNPISVVPPLPEAGCSTCCAILWPIIEVTLKNDLLIKILHECPDRNPTNLLNTYASIYNRAIENEAMKSDLDDDVFDETDNPNNKSSGNNEENEEASSDFTEANQNLPLKYDPADEENSKDIAPAEATSNDGYDSTTFISVNRKEENNTNVNFEELLNNPYYKMNHKSRGHLLIFNHIKFDNPKLQKRTASDRDVMSLQNSFKSLGFTDDYIHVSNDLDSSGVENEIEKYSKMDHSDCDCFVICVLSHGNSHGQVYAKNGSYKIDQLIDPFTGDNCPTLCGKPKIIIIQACQGKDFLKAVKPLRITSTDGVRTFECDGYIPTHADFLIAMATIPGCVAFNHLVEDQQKGQLKGAWFIQELCSALNSDYEKDDLMTILTTAMRRVAYVYYSEDNPDRKRHKQIPYIKSTLTHHIIFNNEKGNY